MRIGPAQTVVPAVRWAQEWQQLGWTATNQAMDIGLRGCASVAMARTPRQALAALQRTQTSLLRHSGDTFVRIARLWHEQNTNLLVIRAGHAPDPGNRPAGRGR
jgi:hypothetical protein